MNQQERLPLLDLFRIFLIFMIIVFHGAIHKFFPMPDNQFLSRNLFAGAIYMDGFFILSGFLLFIKYGHKFRKITIIQIKKFYINRWIKIFTQYYLFLLFIKIFLKEQIPIIIFPIELLGLQSFFPLLWQYAGNGATWFLSAILFSYLTFPFVSYLFGRWGGGIIIMIMLYIFIIYLTIFSAFFPFNLYINPLYRGFQFVIGMCVAYILLFQKRLKKISVIWVLIALGLLFYSINYFFDKNFFNNIKFGTNYVFYTFITIPIFSFIIFVLGGYKKENKNNLLCTVSDLCFPLYVWNAVAQSLVKRYFMETQLPFFYVLLFNFLFAVIALILIDKLLVLFLKKTLINNSN